MNKRVTSDSGDTVSLFPFLAVLLCTMGALLVLLVVLAQRVGDHVVAEAEPAAVAPASFQQPSDEDLQAVANLTSRLKEVRDYQEKLAELRQQAEERLRAEQDQLTHLEEHTRRLEHELARLSVAAEQLKAAEQNQAVDQTQAEHELDRIEQMITEKEEAIKQLQEEVSGRRTYAIVPFLGKDGTTAPRIFIECCREGVIIQPEGIVFDVDDFFAENWSGNPLAQVVRATQQHLQENARSAGETNPQAAVPLLIVRPEGIFPLRVARKALEAAEIKFGFDFVGGDQELTYPVPVDPLLAKKQQHARMNARQELIAHVAAAPREYRKKLEAYAVHANGIGVGTSSAKAALFNRLRQNGTSDSDVGSGEGGSNSGDRFQQQESQYGALAKEGDSAGNATGDTNLKSQSSGGNSEQAEGAIGEESGIGGEQTGSSQIAGQQVPSSSAAAGNSPKSANASGSMSAGAASAAASATNSTGPGEFRDPIKNNAADDQLAAINKNRTRNAVAIQRPIQVIVRKDQFALMASRHVSESIPGTGTVISMNQSTKQIGDELVVALRDHIEQWGIAGRGLYWKPVLSLKVGPDGEDTAIRLAKMLSKSAVEVRLPEEISHSSGGQTDATR